MEAIPTLLVFVVLAYVFARYGGVGGMVAGHCVLAFAVIALDVMWVQDEMSKPGWNGTPDIDLVFSFGLPIRVLIVNTVLLPVSALGLWRRKVAGGVPWMAIDE